MKKAIGRFDRCRSELDIKSRRLTVLSCMPPGGSTHEMRPSFTGTPYFLNAAGVSTTVASRFMAGRPP
jgi:hypothetical protein